MTDLSGYAPLTDHGPDVLLLLLTALAQEDTAWFLTSRERAADLLWRDAHVDGALVRMEPLLLSTPRVWGVDDLRPCREVVRQRRFDEALAAMDRQAEARDAERALEAFAEAEAALSCLDDVLSEEQAAHLYDLASWVASDLLGDRERAAAWLARARDLAPDRPPDYQQDPQLLASPLPGRSVHLLLPPFGTRPVWIDGQAAVGTGLLLSPGPHIVQLPGLEPQSYTILVPAEAPRPLVMTHGADDLAAMRLEDRPDDRQWLVQLLAWAAPDTRGWLVEHDRVWRLDQALLPYTRRPPVKARHVAWGLSASGLVTGGALLAGGLAMHTRLDRCLEDPSLPDCAELIGTTGLLLPDEYNARRRAEVGMISTGGVSLGLSTLALVVVGYGMRGGPHVVPEIYADGAGLRLQGLWGRPPLTSP